MTRAMPIPPGERFGLLTVVERAQGKKKSVCYLCRCDCGGQKTANASDLRHGHTMSCGCLPKGRGHKYEPLSLEKPEKVEKRRRDLSAVFYNPSDMRAGR